MQLNDGHVMELLVSLKAEYGAEHPVIAYCKTISENMQYYLYEGRRSSLALHSMNPIGGSEADVLLLVNSPMQKLMSLLLRPAEASVSELQATLDALQTLMDSFDEEAANNATNGPNKESTKEPTKEPNKEPNKEPTKGPNGYNEPNKEPNKEPSKEPSKEPHGRTHLPDSLGIPQASSRLPDELGVSESMGHYSRARSVLASRSSRSPRSPRAKLTKEMVLQSGVEQSLVSVLSLFAAQPALCRSALRLLLRLGRERDPRFAQPSHHESFYSAVETLIKQEWVVSDLEMLRGLVQACLLADVNRNLDFCNKIVPFFLKVRRTTRDPTLFILYVDAVIDLLLRLAFCASPSFRSLTNRPDPLRAIHHPQLLYRPSGRHRPQRAPPPQSRANPPSGLPYPLSLLPSIPS